MNSDRAAQGSDQATSADGLTFRIKVADSRAFRPGHFVSMQTADDGIRLGQVDRTEVDGLGGSIVTGRIIGAVDQGGSLTRSWSPFESAVATSAKPEFVELIMGGAGAVLEVGQLTSMPGVTAGLIPHRFNRHTFWCGQSGSGKTYALGVLLEELLIHTDLPMIIFDPNADFVRLSDVREDAPPERVAALQRRPVRILRPQDQPGENLRVRFTALPLTAKAAVLRLDPLIDRAEYNTLLHLEEALATKEPTQILTELRAMPDPAYHDIALRIENLGVLQWEIWAGQERAATEILDDRPAATVLDLGGFKFKEEPLVVALAVLDDLWSRRNERRPVLLVIDEAHNLCSPDTDSALQKAVLDRIIQIAAEGRKYGLWLLLSTQRPSKVHQGIISQCDNLALMRMSSQRDLDELATIFAFAPPAMLAQSPLFRQGETLFAGGFAAAPSGVSMRPRLTHEGGRDVAVPLAPSTP